MTITQRFFQSTADLYAIGNLIRRAYAAQPNWNTYSFARFDIWMQRRIADEVLFNKSDWQQDIQLWESDGNLIGAVFFESPSDAALIGDPAHPDLIEPMLDWAERRYREKGSDQPLMIEALESNVARCDLLKSRGYTLFPGYFIHRHKPLDPNEIEPVNLPPGFSIKPIETEEDRRLYPIAVQSVFNRSATVEQDEFLKARAIVHAGSASGWCGQINTRSRRSARCGSIPSTTTRSLNRWARCRVFRSADSVRRCWPTRTIACARRAARSPRCNRGALR